MLERVFIRKLASRICVANYYVVSNLTFSGKQLIFIQGYSTLCICEALRIHELYEMQEEKLDTAFESMTSKTAQVTLIARVTL